MCRGKDHGGRRCPSERDPEKIKARNARRRNLYHFKKLQQSAQISPDGFFNPQAMEALKAFTVAHPELINQQKKVNAKPNTSLPGGFTEVDKTLPQELPQVQEQDSSSFALQESVARKHNVKADIYSGADVDNGYIAKEQLHGTIDYTTLNEKSYKTFGFQSPEQTRKAPLNVRDLISYSEEQMKGVDMVAQGGIYTITTNQYEWINSALHGSRSGIKLVSDLKDTSYLEKVNPDASHPSEVGFHYTPEEERTPARLQQIVDAADKGLQDATDGRQHIVYRGVHGKNHFIKNAGGLDAYVDENYQLGSTVQWDGYSSTCMVPDIAADYAREDHGIIYEIRAASGVNVSGISHFKYEKEYLLPRASKFMVVGVHKNVNWKYERRDSKDNIKTDTNTSMTVIQLVEVTDDGRIQDSETVKTRQSPALEDWQMKHSKEEA